MLVQFATFNIQYGVGQDGIYDLRRSIDAVRDADIICLQEVAQHWQRNDLDDQPRIIADALNAHYVYGSAFDVDASFVDRGGRVVNRRRTFGNMVLSRWPIISTRTLPLGKRPVFGGADVQRCAVEAVVDVAGERVRFYSLHLSHVSSGQRAPQIERLIEYVRTAPGNGAAWDYVGPNDIWEENRYDVTPPAPAIIAGDFNTAPDWPEYELLAGERHPVRGTRLVAREGGLYDAWVLAGHEEQEGFTFPHETLKPSRIDHVFVTPGLRERVKAMRVGDTVTASDHYPVFVDLELGN